MKNTIKILLFIFLLHCSSVFALDLSSAKEKGLIGEQHNGYIGLVNKTSPNVTALVKKTNNKRKQHYQAIAKKRNLQLNQVELVAGSAAIKKTKKGNYIQLKGENWKKK